MSRFRFPRLYRLLVPFRDWGQITEMPASLVSTTLLSSSCYNHLRAAALSIEARTLHSMSRAGDVNVSSLIRRDPAPLYRSDRSRLSALWSLIRVFTALPFTLVASTVSYLSGAQPRWKTLPATWFFALRKLQSSHLTPLVDPLEWDQPPPASSLVPEVVSGRLARRGMGCERVIVAPVSEELIGGIANVAQVKSVPRPGWMVWPARSTGDSAAKVYAGGNGFEKARSDEKVLYYLVGG